MNQLYIVIKDFLDSLFPEVINSTWGNLNELIAILFTYGILYFFIVRPIFNLFNGKKRK